MLLGVAVPVARLVEDVFGATLTDIDTDIDLDREPERVPMDPEALALVVGRQQIQPNGRVRIGSEVLTLLRAKLPKTILYVVPDRYEAGRYQGDRDVLEGLCADGHTVYVLEVAVMRSVGEAAAGFARETLAQPPPSTPTLLLGDHPQD